ncbi:arginine--tRNA ligase [Salmonella enterica subsp. houtenae serovar 48:z4,z32:-]|uniref:Arginine--tRNA ligase n=1 Tax=Salmonella enterica subsp. houtenae serovar 48:z4,z32:- TaxID=2577535 RepID=A0A729FZJ5_SALHO|nr:arginine--tRNA ligase [Salmonella enterica subsp. houtenae]EAN3148028.1 arginine--tRNA ligase [Salmonella enterica]EBI0350053.1 arginine--tRNA ligase [Salmonella enterica subsp. arizonae serovar 48:z4,z23,z32:-]EDU9325370.1 arginine--tRNA ligase [Salmonella enterica subsp. enterica]EDW4111105.1 arginine--tRNA ligase [Salmonella enterica subsp. arizonae]EDW5429965.1 arginine--tRNA ligase [Salmonella enterica subsp. enterica serovar Djakarta]EEE1666679.1 arginine--tRNA ligase [Salmonella ent
MNIQALLSEKVSQAMIAAGAPADCEPQVRQSAKVQFGDYQANGMMAVAKKLGMAPRQLAEQVLTHLDLSSIASKVEIAGPGFINIFLEPAFLAEQVQQALASNRLGVSQPTRQTIVVDYSAPNVAKEMHVGHLRSTIIGDAAVRTLEFLGHHVIRANHVGDWGTQFGMLIAWLEKQQQENAGDMALADLEGFYRDAKKHYDEDEAFAERARNYVVKLQSGDAYFREMWRKLVDITMTQNQITYDRLNVTLTRDDVMGESLYNPMLPGIVADLKAKGLAVESEGATVVFLDEFKNKEGDPMGVIIQKKDGGYLYTTTDIACAKYRYETLHADRVLYYIDSRQHQHLMQAWTIVRKAGYVPDSVPLEHHMFGMMLGKDGKPFKTRAGGTVKLADLLDEALERARRLVAEKNPDMPADELEKLANAVGIGAVKYADLSKNRTTDYIFDWDNMLAFEGNTAPYMQYAYTRVLSVFRKADIDEQALASAPVIISEDREAQLAARLLQFEETLTVVAREGTPHVMCAYLYDVAGLFSGFYEHCPILSAENDAVRNSRLKLAQLTAKTLKLGLDTLGIETVERM